MPVTITDQVYNAVRLPDDWATEPVKRRSATAASFAAALELVKAGRLAIRQDAPFQPIYLMRRDAEDAE